jgi:RNA polymerase sigma-70 factor (ECF subfamily)
MPETDVDDVVQETFIAAWRHLASYDPARPFRGWLFRIALNKMRDLRRGIACALSCSARCGSMKGLMWPMTPPDAERHVAATRELAAIRAKLRGLDGGLGEALVLTAIVGMTRPRLRLRSTSAPRACGGRVARARQSYRAARSGKSETP